MTFDGNFSLKPQLPSTSSFGTIVVQSFVRFDTISTFDVGDNVSWIKPIPSLLVPKWTTGNVTVELDISNLSAGTYQAAVTITSYDVNHSGNCFLYSDFVIVSVAVTNGDQGVPLVVSIIVYVTCAIGVLLCMAMFFSVFLWRQNKWLSSIGPKFVLVNVFGGLLICLAPIFLSPLSRTCFAGACLFSIGVVFFFSPLIVKSYRLYKVHDNAKKLKLSATTDEQLLGAMIVFISIDGVILGIWGGISLPHSEYVTQDNSEHTIIQKCNWGEHGTAFLITQCIYLAFLLVLAAVMAHASRNLFTKKRNILMEADEIFFTCYNFAVSLTVVVILFVVLSENPTAWILIISLGLVMGVFFSISGLYMFRLRKIMLGVEWNLASEPRVKSGPVSSNTDTSRKGSSP
eukprot:TRINITY_DN2500_c0_g1_i8.p1 TRINITY_DN2500_c0_g1~~TRINITY_DN2500_c0_g1_i8.p1  ORF type:complete len:402 (-),score=69.37 TRINITY_DN2500_c0_g1_i8:154-1359(-)